MVVYCLVLWRWRGCLCDEEGVDCVEFGIESIDSASNFLSIPYKLYKQDNIYFRKFLGHWIPLL
jgi:hypothetical protein